MDINGFQFDWRYDASTRGQELPEPFLKVKVDAHLLKQVFDRQLNWNDLEVGCRVRFDRRPNIYKPDCHTLLSWFHP